MDWLWSRSIHYLQAWIDFGPEVYTSCQNESTLVQKCIVFARMDWLWPRSVHYLRDWITFGPEMYSVCENGLTLVPKCTIFKNRWSLERNPNPRRLACWQARSIPRRSSDHTHQKSHPASLSLLTSSLYPASVFQLGLCMVGRRSVFGGFRFFFVHNSAAKL